MSAQTHNHMYTLCQPTEDAKTPPLFWVLYNCSTTGGGGGKKETHHSGPVSTMHMTFVKALFVACATLVVFAPTNVSGQQRSCDSQNGDYYPGLSIDRSGSSNCYGWIAGAWQYAGLSKTKWPYYKRQISRGDWYYIYYVSAIPLFVIVAYELICPCGTRFTVVNERLCKYFPSDE